MSNKVKRQIESKKKLNKNVLFKVFCAYFGESQAEFQFFQKLLMDLKHQGIYLYINIIYGTIPENIRKKNYNNNLFKNIDESNIHEIKLYCNQILDNTTYKVNIQNILLLSKGLCIQHCELCSIEVSNLESILCDWCCRYQHLNNVLVGSPKVDERIICNNCYRNYKNDIPITTNKKILNNLDLKVLSSEYIISCVYGTKRYLCNNVKKIV